LYTEKDRILKPGYIFSAVFVIALAMAVGLPQLTAVPSVQAAEPFPYTVFVDPNKIAQPALDQSESSELREAAPAAAAADSSTAAVLQDTIPLTSIVAPELESFINSVVNHRAGQVVGVYVPGVFALPIQQQPAGNHSFITPFDGAITQYGPPLAHGTISLLAHNYLSGRVFFNLKIGQQVTLVFGDGSLDRYQITTIDNYQALSPTDPYSDFINQNDASGAVQSFQQVYDRYYKVDGQLVFQTCVEKFGDLSWGRVFIVAQPY
jgi:hypothetical protein